MPRPGRFTPGNETRYPLYWRRGGTQGRSERMRNISPSSGFDPRTYNIVYNILFILYDRGKNARRCTRVGIYIYENARARVTVCHSFLSSYNIANCTECQHLFLSNCVYSYEGLKIFIAAVSSSLLSINVFQHWRYQYFISF